MPNLASPLHAVPRRSIPALPRPTSPLLACPNLLCLVLLRIAITCRTSPQLDSTRLHCSFSPKSTVFRSRSFHRHFIYYTVNCVFFVFPSDNGALFFNHNKNDLFQITPDFGHLPAPLFTGFPSVCTKTQLSVIRSTFLEKPDLVKI